MAATVRCVDLRPTRGNRQYLADAADFYIAAFATPLLVTATSQQAVPTSASSLSSGFPRGIRFLGNPTTLGHTPDGLLPGQQRPGLVTSFPGTVWR
jgi:hypothetical protein